MKRLKLLLFILTILFLVVAIVRFTVRRPYYTIQTSGKLYIVNKLSRDVTVFDLMKGEEIKTIPIEVECHNAVALSNQERIILPNYSSNKIADKSVTIIHAQSNKLEKKLDLGKKYLGLDGIVAFPKSNKIGVISSVSNDLLIVDIATGILEKIIATQQLGSHLLVLHPFEPIAFITNNTSNSVSVINLDLKKVTNIIPCESGTDGIDITPDGSEIWVTNNIKNSITVINAKNNQIIASLKTRKAPKKLKFSNDGKYCLVANSADGTISVYNQQFKKEIKIITLHGKKTAFERFLYHTPRPVNILTHPNGLYAFVSNSNANKIEVIDMKTFTIVSTIGTGKIPDGMAFVK